MIESFDWTIVIFGLFLAYTGIKTIISGREPINFRDSRVLRIASKLIPVTHDYDGDRFFTRLPSGKAVATPLFIVLIVLNITDILFAFDSIPAIFAITRDPFIVYTSNVFALLGLRALYFVLSGLIDKFRYLKYGLSLGLIFIGLKMIINYPGWLGRIPTEWTLGITAFLILGSIFVSLVRDRLDEG